VRFNGGGKKPKITEIFAQLFFRLEVCYYIGKSANCMIGKSEDDGRR
jgi:hypothetical protein